MEHVIDLEHQAARIAEGADLCVQCGLCLSVCPTYALTGEEIQSPRGRVMLYRAAAVGELMDDQTVLKAAYDCLDCQACQTICPSGVKPGELALETRAALQGGQTHSPPLRAMLEAFKHPWAMDLVNAALLGYQRSGLQGWVRGSGLLRGLASHYGGRWADLQTMESLLPQRPIAPAMRLRRPRWTPHRGAYRGTVAFFLGCVMNAVFSEASAASCELLARNGYDVVLLPETSCCGAPHIEEGDDRGYRQLAAKTARLYGDLAVDAIVTDCAACGAELKKLGRYFADDPELATPLARVSALARGISEFLRWAGIRETGATGPGRPTTYQDACHLCHAQGICKQPRELLQDNPQVAYVELEGADACCGSAGIYNLSHRETSQELLKGKVERVRRSGAEVLAAENPGCLLQLEAGCREAGLAVEVRHTSLILLDAYLEGEAPGGA